MSSTLSIVYLISDLLPQRHDLQVRGDGAIEVHHFPEGDPWADYARRNIPCWKAAFAASVWTFPADPTPGDIARAIELDYPRPRLSLPGSGRAQEAAATLKKTVRLTADELLADAEFARLARATAESGKGYTADLLAWEDRATVQEAVARVRVTVDAELAEREREQARVRRAAERQAQRERPTREAVMAAYQECDYRVCTQGHTLRILLDDTPASTADTQRGEQYSSRCTYRKTESIHTITVRQDWLDTVAARGLATFAGELILEVVSRGYTPEGREVLDLRSVRQGRGAALETRRVRVLATRGDSWEVAPEKVELLTRPQLLALARQRAGLGSRAPLFAIADRLAEQGDSLAGPLARLAAGK